MAVVCFNIFLRLLEPELFAFDTGILGGQLHNRNIIGQRPCNMEKNLADSRDYP